ncbi:MAG: DUF4390 domain-containing protein [Burkholderiales bacterium]|nr:DUF4390 domain-containing protein [Burkholderiales bacterium]
MQARRFLALVGVLLFTLFARAENIEVRSANITLREDTYALDADFEIALTPTLEDILGKGVPLNFLLELELIRPRWYWLNDRVAAVTQQYKLSYNSLTRQYRVSLGTLYQNFASLGEAVRFIGGVRNLPVAEKSALQPGVSYQGAVRLRLDVSQLPKPFQITALGSREWNVSSDWYRFAVNP